MVDNNWLAERFEAQTTHLRAVAYRMLGSMTEAEDAVQEAWLRLTRSETSAVENLGGWLTTVVARICLDMLRSRKSLPEEPLSTDVPESIASRKEVIQPETEMLVADSVGLALLVVLETLSPAERVAFVLHDMFDLPFDEIAPIVGRSTTAARQLASRARRRVQGASAVSDADFTRQREVVDAFLAASRGGDFGALLAVLDPEVVLRADSAAVQAAAANRGRGAPELSSEVRGARAVADTFKGRAGAAQSALVNGAVGAVWAPGGQPRAALSFNIQHRKIVEIEIAADPARLHELDVAVLNG